MQKFRRPLAENSKRFGQNNQTKIVSISDQFFAWFQQSPPKFELLNLIRILFFTQI